MKNEYKTLDQEILDLFKKRNIQIVNYHVKYKNWRKTFMWTIEGKK